MPTVAHAIQVMRPDLIIHAMLVFPSSMADDQAMAMGAALGMNNTQTRQHTMTLDSAEWSPIARRMDVLSTMMVPRTPWVPGRRTDIIDRGYRAHWMTNFRPMTLARGGDTNGPFGQHQHYRPDALVYSAASHLPQQSILAVVAQIRELMPAEIKRGWDFLQKGRRIPPGRIT